MTATRIPPHVQSVMDPDGAVLLDLKQGKYFSLNGVAAVIWERLSAGDTPEQVEAHLRRTYDAPAETLRADLDAFLARLARERLVDAGR